VHHDALMLPLDVISNDYIFGNNKLKAVSASASKDKNGAVHISLVNIDAHNAQDINMDITGLPSRSVTGRILHSEKIQDHNSFENPEKIKPAVFNGVAVSGSTLTLKMPPFSVIVLELK